MGWFAACSSNTATGPGFEDALTVTPEIVSFSGIEENDSTEISIQNISGGELTIYSANISESYVNVRSELPVTLANEESLTWQINFNYEESDGETRTELEISHSDSANSPAEVAILLPAKRVFDQRTFSERDEWAFDFHEQQGILVKRKNRWNYLIGTLPLDSDSLNSLTSMVTSETEITPVAYSPDGNKILYYKDYSDSSSRIYTISTGGGDPVALTDSSFRDIPVDYSPDGERIIMHSDRSGNREIYLMNSDGSDVRRYTDHPAKDTPVGITSDNRYLIFNSERNSRNNRKNIFRLNADDGTALRQITDNDVEDEAVDLSPSGNRILFFSQREGNREIYVMDVNGNEVRQITNNHLLDYPVDFHPEGTNILFFSRRSTNIDIYTISDRGVLERRITTDYAEDRPVMFINEGEMILFNSNRNDNYDVYTSPAPGY